MSRNVGRLDRMVRLVLGVMVLGLYGAVDPPLKYFTLLGLVLVATAVSGFCPIYALFGIRTGKQPE